ncbi:MAG TPA: HAD-IC family P-type ATPase, partial [Spirochaetia bacterium]|nr:HAD-IC family P-type ATPase [Spirochaetia bacterium]
QTRNGVSPSEVLRCAALAEAHSNHPIAASIRAACGVAADGSAVQNCREIAGEGVEARVENRMVMAGNDRLLHAHGIEHDTCCTAGTAVHVVIDGGYAGYIEIGDELRPGAADAVRALRRLGVTRTVLLTGDDRQVARHTAERLGIDEFHGELRPSDKVALVERILSETPSGRTAFVGDGINDAPVLARADVGIAMGASGADAAVETADVVLMSDALSKVPEAITRGRRTRAIVMQNIVLALGVKAVFLGLGALGIATMWEAVIGDMGVALLAIANALRAFR